MRSISGDATEDVELLHGQVEVYKHVFAYADSLVLRSVVELRIPDIIHSHGKPMSLSQIASKIESSSVDIGHLARVMRMLVRKNIFTVDYVKSTSGDEESEPLYGLTSTSKWLLSDEELSLAPMLLTFTDPVMTTAWYQISPAIKEGGTPFVKAHGQSFWEMASNSPAFNNMFNDGMTAATKHILDAIIKGYEDGFIKMEGTLVDVGGNRGRLVAKIVKAYPHIKGINFDMPHAIANAPQYPGVTNVGGDMFKEIPSADNVIIKSVLIDWPDEHCLTILKNCRKAVSEKKGKVIIVDVIVHPERYEMFDDAAVALDLLMMTNFIGGKERTEKEWIQLLNKAGFTDINIIPLQSLMSTSEFEEIRTCYRSVSVTALEPEPVQNTSQSKLKSTSTAPNYQSGENYWPQVSFQSSSFRACYLNKSLNS